MKISLTLIAVRIIVLFEQKQTRGNARKHLKTNRMIDLWISSIGKVNDNILPISRENIKLIRITYTLVEQMRVTYTYQVISTTDSVQ